MLFENLRKDNNTDQQRFVDEKCDSCEYNSCTLNWCIGNCTVPLMALDDLERQREGLLTKPAGE